MLSEDHDKLAIIYSPVTCVTHKRFAILALLPAVLWRNLSIKVIKMQKTPETFKSTGLKMEHKVDNKIETHAKKLKH